MTLHEALPLSRHRGTVILYKIVIPLYICRTKAKKMETSVLTVKGQLLIPKRIRNKYGIKSGVKVIFEETENGVIIRPMKVLPVLAENA